MNTAAPKVKLSKAEEHAQMMREAAANPNTARAQAASKVLLLIIAELAATKAITINSQSLVQIAAKCLPLKIRAELDACDKLRAEREAESLEIAAAVSGDADEADTDEPLDARTLLVG